jgi:hypothetical protein
MAPHRRNLFPTASLRLLLFPLHPIKGDPRPATPRASYPLSPLAQHRRRSATAAVRRTASIRSSGASPSLPSSQVSPPCPPLHFGAFPVAIGGREALFGRHRRAFRRGRRRAPLSAAALLLPCAAGCLILSQQPRSTQTPRSNQVVPVNPAAAYVFAKEPLCFPDITYVSFHLIRSLQLGPGFLS